jgi:hypothetical protein
MEEAAGPAGWLVAAPGARTARRSCVRAGKTIRSAVSLAGAGITVAGIELHMVRLKGGTMIPVSPRDAVSHKSHLNRSRMHGQTSEGLNKRGVHGPKLTWSDVVLWR